MAFEHKEGNGSLFLEENKRGGAPDYKGSIKINGETIRLAAWKNTTKTGKEMLGLQVDTYTYQKEPVQHVESKNETTAEEDPDNDPF